MNVWNFARMEDGRIRVNSQDLARPRHWGKSRLVRVNVTADIFHPTMPADILDDMLYLMQKNSQHTYFIWTRKPNKMQLYADSESYRAQLMARMLHVFWGIKADNQASFDAQADLMRGMVLSNRWISLSGYVNLSRHMMHPFSFDPARPGLCDECGQPRLYAAHLPDYISCYDWIVTEGSITGDDEWLRYAKYQATQAGVPLWVNTKGAPEDCVKRQLPDLLDYPNMLEV